MTRTIEPLKTKQSKHVSLYTCGPTVYDYPQIGNWATYVRWDTLVRMLQKSGYDVAWVMNITDVGHLTSDADEGEDKLEKGARREGKTAWQIAKFYTNDFVAGMQKLNIQHPTHLVPATSLIKEQIALIQKLEAQGYTYRIDDGIYFDTQKLSDYGKLARLDTEGLRAGARVEFNTQKHRLTDFALWKFNPQNEQRDMEWDSPWGRGFPGWHLECSAIAMHYLGETLDIHAGGIDFIPVHHTNEIAQSEAATGKPFATLWLHGNFITVNGVKLSKSLGNSFTLQDIIAKGFEPLDLRLLFLQSHYRTQADFTWESLTAARQRRQDLQAMADVRWQFYDTAPDMTQELQASQQAILKALQQDLGTPHALALLSNIEQQLITHGIAPSCKKALIEFLDFIDRLFGLELTQSSDITDNQKQFIKEREQARARKDWVTSDVIRDQLQAQGLGLRDTRQGAYWYRT